MPRLGAGGSCVAGALCIVSGTVPAPCNMGREWVSSGRRQARAGVFFKSLFLSLRMNLIKQAVLTLCSFS